MPLSFAPTTVPGSEATSRQEEFEAALLRYMAGYREAQLGRRSLRSDRNFWVSWRWLKRDLPAPTTG